MVMIAIQTLQQWSSYRIALLLRLKWAMNPASGCRGHIFAIQMACCCSDSSMKLSSLFSAHFGSCSHKLHVTGGTVCESLQADKQDRQSHRPCNAAKCLWYYTSSPSTGITCIRQVAQVCFRYALHYSQDTCTAPLLATLFTRISQTSHCRLQTRASRQSWLGAPETY